MFSSTQDTERVIPQKQFDIFSLMTQGLIFLVVLLVLVGPLLAGYVPSLSEFFDNLFGALYGNSFYLVFIGFIIIVIGISQFSRWIQRKRWMAMAEFLGLQYEQKYLWNSPTLKGTHRAHQIKIVETSKRSGRNRVYYTNFVVGLTSPTEYAFTIQKRSISNFNQLKTGDAEFDKKFSTQTSSEKLLQKILRTHRLRLGILQLGERSRSRFLGLSRETLAFVEHGKLLDTEYMQAALTFLVELTNTIESMEQLGQLN